jgi:hypothetical protein
VPIFKEKKSPAFHEFINPWHELILSILDKSHAISWRWRNAVLQKITYTLKTSCTCKFSLPITCRGERQILHPSVYIRIVFGRDKSIFEVPTLSSLILSIYRFIYRYSPILSIPCRPHTILNDSRKIMHVDKIRRSNGNMIWGPRNHVKRLLKPTMKTIHIRGWFPYRNVKTLMHFRLP